MTLFTINKKIGKLGIKKTVLAQNAGISYSYLNFILKGERSPKNLPEILKKINNAIAVN